MAFPPKAQAALDAEPSEESEPVDLAGALNEATSCLEKISSAFASGEVSEKDQGRLESIQSQLNQLKESLNMEPGQDPESTPTPTGRLSAEAGAKDVKPVY
jgi:hypothetical protein